MSQRTHWHDARICLGENPAKTFKRFDLCYSFKMLCWAEYDSTHQLHLAAKNYMHNYSARLCQNWQIPYEHTLRNLVVALVLGWFHHWQRWVGLEDHDKPDWAKVPVLSVGDFRHKYSPTLVLLGNTQHLTYAHPKLLGQCYDNVYHQGQLIGNLPAWGKLPSKEQTQKIYNQEYKEVVAWIENTLDLSDESLTYLILPTSLLNPDIVLPHRLGWEQHGLPKLPLSRMPKPQEFNIDGIQGLVDLSWNQ